MKNKLNHIAFIMDGNKRWAKKNNKDQYFSYTLGAENLIKLSNYIFSNYETNIISAFALSNSNLKRPIAIINIIKKILINFLDKELQDQKIKFNIKFIGDLNFLDKEILNKISLLENRVNKSNKILLIFINYSGKLDIINSVLKIKYSISNKSLLKNFHKFLLTSNYPDPDLLIRTGGHQRISDFMLYQLSFTELIFLKKLWIDLNFSDLRKIYYKYKNMNRKFGV